MASDDSQTPKKTPKPSDPPRTLADYIDDQPPEETRRKAREKLTRAEAERLEALEQAVRDTEPDAVRRRSKRSRSRKGTDRRGSDRSGQDLEDYYANKGWKQPRRKGGRGKVIFWGIILMIIVAYILD